MAVGGYFDRSLDAEAMAAAGSRGRWAPARELPVPAGAAANPGASLSSVWCPAAGACLAVGGYETATLDKLGLAAAGSPGRWRAGPIPLPANAAPGSGLNFDVYASVSCIPARFCVTAGSYITRSGTVQPATAMMSAGHWTARQMPLPAGAAADPMAALAAVSCAATFCQAVGWFTLRSGAELPMTIRRASGRWGPVSLAALPANARAGAGQSASLAAVTCTQTGRCTAAGSYLDTAGRTQAMVATRL